MSVAPPPAATGRNAYIDALRGWSIFGVVCVHFAGSFVTTDTNAWSPSFYLGLVLNQFFSFAVPLFVFLSGFLAGSSTRTVTLGTYYAGRFRRIVLPYLAASIASFFLLNHYAEWLALPDMNARWSWLAAHVFYYGVEPTLYFIPLIIYLYVLQPALKALPGWLSRLTPARWGFGPERSTLTLTTLFLALHAALGLACYRGALNYYDWGRPNPLFWMFYFFSGLHFRSLASFVARRGLAGWAGAALLAALAAMTWNGIQLTDRTVVGANFELNRLDFAYARPEMLVYDLGMVIFLAAGIAVGWNWRAGLVTYLGRFTLEIYLWHILVLYYGAWRYAEVLESCRQMPELIVLICTATCLAIAGIAGGVPRLLALIRGHRIVIVKVE